MKENIRNFLKKTLYFLRKSYPKPIMIIIGLLLLISFVVGYKITVEQKAGVEQKVFKREQEIITEYNKELVEIEKNKESLKNFGGYEWFTPTGSNLESELRWDSEFNKLKAIKDTPFYKLWLENFINHSFFILAVLAILILPIIRVLFLFGLSIKKQFQEIRRMPMFQKYLIGLLFGVLIVLILILLKIF